MQPIRKLNRRSFMTRVVGGGVLAGTLAILGSDAGAVQVTDCDRGAGADPGGRGTGRTVRTGVSDRDPGDPAGCGRGTAAPPPTQQCPRSGITDSDTGEYADPVQGGRGNRPRDDAWAACFRARRGYQD